MTLVALAKPRVNNPAISRNARTTRPGVNGEHVASPVEVVCKLTLASASTERSATSAAKVPTLKIKLAITSLVHDGTTGKTGWHAVSLVEVVNR